MLFEFPYPDNETELNVTVCLIIHKATKKIFAFVSLFLVLFCSTAEQKMDNV